MSPPSSSFTKVWHNKLYPSISPTRPELSAYGKVVIITGGGIGIGAAIAKSFAQAGAAAIGIIGRREQHLKNSVAAISAISSSTKAEYAIADITNKEVLQAAFEQFASNFGKIDVFVSNAGHLSSIAPIDASDSDDWWEGFEVNIKGSFNAIRTFLPHAARNAVVLNVNAGLATRPSIPGLSSYSSSKIASAKLFEHLQVEHPELRVVNVHPGVVETAMTEKTRVTANDDRKCVGMVRTGRYAYKR